jgi:hypothetical protein
MGATNVSKCYCKATVPPLGRAVALLLLSCSQLARCGRGLSAQLPMQLGGGWIATREARPMPKTGSQSLRSLGRAARQLLQHCLNTAQQGPRRQLEQNLALTNVRLTAGASGRLCARQEARAVGQKQRSAAKVAFGASSPVAKVGNGGKI